MDFNLEYELNNMSEDVFLSYEDPEIKFMGDVMRL